MKKIIILFIILLPILATAQQPKMHIKFFGGMNISSLVYRIENVDSDLLGGVQLGGGFRISKRHAFAEIDFTFRVKGITYSPTEDDELPFDEDVNIIFREFEIPVIVRLCSR